MAATKSRSTDNRDEKTEQTLSAHLVGGEESFTYTEVFAISEIERNPNSQSRLGKVNTSYVGQLVENMKSGVTFAPVVLWQTPDNGAVLVDGNHRVAAYSKRGIVSIPAYLVKLPGGMNEAVYLSAVFNGMNGQRLTADELKRAVIAAGNMKPEPNNARLAADYGVSAAQIGRIRTEQATRDRLEALAVAGCDDLGQGHVLPLAKISLDEPFKQAASLIVDAQMSPTDAKDLVKDLTGAGSESLQLDRIGHERTQRAEDIEAVARGRKSTGSPQVDLRRSISRIENLRKVFPNIGAWVSTDPTVIELWAPRIVELAEFFDELQAAYGKAGEESSGAESSAA